MTQKGLHCLVTGTVQGVFYRENTRRKALELEITGWVRNVPDGSVEIYAFGEPEQLEIFSEWLWEGPSAAKVASVECQEIPWQSFSSFTVS